MVRKIIIWGVLIFSYTVLWGQQVKDTPSMHILVDWLSGIFQNSDQLNDLDSTISRVPARSGVWLNELCLQHRRIDAPALGTHVLYLTWRERDCEAGTINRNRLWSFQTDESGQIIMDFYAFPADCPIEDHLSQDRLQKEQLIGYPPGCTIAWSWEQDQFVGRLDQSTCHTVAQVSGRVIHLGAEIRVRSNGFQYAEQGVYEQGESAFKVPGWPFYQFDKNTP